MRSNQTQNGAATNRIISLDESADAAPSTRSFAPLTTDHLSRLQLIASSELVRIFQRAPVAGLYSDRLALMVLAQGAAQHFLDGRHGVKDLDVWVFFANGPRKPFPWRARWTCDFGRSALGHHPDDSGFAGRRIDILGRSIAVRANESIEDTLRAWLSGGTASAKALRSRPIIGLHPPAVFGQTLWPPKTTPSVLSNA